MTGPGSAAQNQYLKQGWEHRAASWSQGPQYSPLRPGGKGWKVTLPQQPNLVLSNPQASVSGLYRRQELWTGQGVRKGSRASFLGTPFPDRYSERLLLPQVQ